MLVVRSETELCPEEEVCAQCARGVMRMMITSVASDDGKTEERASVVVNFTGSTVFAPL